MSTLLRCRGLRAEAGTRTLFGDIALTMREGDRIGLVGKNGCGKSTLLSMLGQERSPDAGEITWRSGLRLTAV